MQIAPSGYDLEVPDADGRRTLHGCLHEHNFDCAFYADSINNGFHAIMALGVVGAWAAVSEDPDVQSYLHDELVGQRRLHEIARDDMIGVYGAEQTNYSNVNMAFMASWMACRVIDDPEVRAVLAEAVGSSMYDLPGETHQPIEQQTPFFDFTYAACTSGQSAQLPPTSSVDLDAVERGLQTLRDFSDAPYWSFGEPLCPAAVCTCEDKYLDDDAKDCTAHDGTHFDVLGCVGRNCDLISDQVVPMKIRGPSNYHWRSNPYQPNRAGDGGQLLPAVDFRGAYWLGRWARR